MAWFNNPSIWLVITLIMIIIVVLICWFVPKCTSKPVEPTGEETVADNVVTYIDDGETILDIEEEDDEQFGMYSSALSSWLAHHPSGSSVERYTRPSKQQIQPSSPVMTDYIPYRTFSREADDHIRSKNPQFSNHIRTTVSDEVIGDEETTLL